METYLAVLAFVTGFGLPVGVIFASTAQGRATAAALESIGRQPEAAAKVQLTLVIGLALIEALIIYSLLMFFLLLGKLPNIEDVFKLSESKASAMVSPSKVLVKTASNTLDANGTTSTTITVQALDENDTPLKGQIIAMTVEGGGVITSPAKDNKDGSYTALYTVSDRTGKVNVRATASNGVFGSVTLSLD